MSSNLPTDTRPSLGLNGLMDRYPDEDYGMGVLNPDILPPKGDASSDDGAGEASLPDGIVQAAMDELGVGFAGDAAMSLNDLGQTVLAAHVADLSWLEVDEEDLSRLPKNPVNLSIPELEAAFADHRGTPGIHFTANNVDPEVARYRSSLLAAATTSEVPYEALQVLARKAMRLSAANPDAPFKAVLAQLKTAMANMPDVYDHLDKLKPVLATIADEHGLAGRVFIRAEAYPNYEQGDWTNDLRRCADAKWIVLPKSKHNAAHHIEGVCTITGKRIVAKVPWARARQEYAPKLKATGRAVAGSGDPKAALKAAFAKTPKTLEGSGSLRPRHVAPSERVAFEDAQAALQAHKPERKVLSRRAQEQERKVKAAQLQIVKWVRKGSLSKERGTAIVTSGLAPEAMLRAAAAEITKAATGSDFTGLHNEGAVGALPEVSEKAARSAMAATLAARQEAQARVAADAAARRKGETKEARALKGLQARVAKITQAIDRGVRGQMLRRLIRTTIKSAELKAAAKLLDPILKKTGALDESAKPKKTARYSGSGGTAQREHVQLRTASHAPNQRELETYIKWARLTLADGIVGADFDAIASTRWSKNIRAAGAAALQVLRERHEGLSGHLYVDAAAYASKKGTKGCDEGALHHRTGSTRFVLACSRCSGCAFANKRQGGGSVCQKYNKDIITASQLPPDHARAYQQRTIRAAGETDAETVASLFAPGYDPNEFELTTAMQIDAASIASSPIEPLQDIWFGGDVPLELDPMADPSGISFR